MQNSSFDSQLKALSDLLLPYSPIAYNEEAKCLLESDFIGRIHQLSYASSIAIENAVRNVFCLKNDNEVFKNEAVKIQLANIENYLQQRINSFSTLVHLSTPKQTPPRFSLEKQATIHTYYADHASDLNYGLTKQVAKETPIPSFSPPDDIETLLNDFVKVEIPISFSWKDAYYLIQNKQKYCISLEKILDQVKRTKNPEEFKQWINQVESEGLTLLHQAVLQEKFEMIQELIKCGANIHQMTLSKETVIDLAYRIEDETIRNKVLHYLSTLGVVYCRK
jgi:ankyrin repeat protein